MKLNDIAAAAAQHVHQAARANRKLLVYETGSISMTREQQLKKFGFYPVPPLVQGNNLEEFNAALAEMKARYLLAPQLVKQRTSWRTWWGRKYVRWTVAALAGLGAFCVLLSVAVYIQRDMYLKQVDSFISQVKHPAHVSKKEQK